MKKGTRKSVSPVEEKSSNLPIQTFDSKSPKNCCENCPTCDHCRRPWWKPKNYTPILMALLLVAAFLIGMLIDKVQYLQNGGTPAGNNQQAQAPNQPSTAPVKANVGVGHLPPKGNTNAPVKIIEFADLRCPFCKQFFDNDEAQIIKDYVNNGKAQFIFRHYAFLGPASTVAANAAECANEQGKFWEFHDYMYQHQPDESDTSLFTVDNLTPIAGTLGMNTDQFRSCLSSNKYSKNVTDDFNAGQQAGVSGTPTFYVNGTQLVGAEPYDVFKTAIDQALAKK